ncbi:MFS transporter [Bosea sp. LjRoot90]|uniref:MFS transporter n=1 Tax=Bosea sp. LjRoot90 TaxID=3342342 RepID=UPI003ECDFCAC
MISRSTVFCLGLAQLISWGVSYYLVGAFGEPIAAEFGWSQAIIHGGLSAGLLVMGLTSGAVGRLIDRHGGRNVMCAGSLLTAVGIAGLAFAQTIAAYYAAWICLGLAMRLTLYDAAFAALAYIGGSAARRPIAQITLLGGLASTVFWPLGHALAEQFGWRGALLAYAGFALLTLPLHLTLPAGSARPLPDASAAKPVSVLSPADTRFAGILYALIVTFAGILNAGMSAHMIGILAGLGLPAAAAVWISSTRGIGQSLARLGEVLFGSRTSPFDLNLVACLVLPLCFVVGLAGGASAIAALVFAFAYGAGNGVLTITRGTLPLMLFDPRSYGAYVGRLLAPGFFLSAAAPLGYALLIERYGASAALILSGALAVAMLVAAILLRRHFRSLPRS